MIKPNDLVFRSLELDRERGLKGFKKREQKEMSKIKCI